MLRQTLAMFVGLNLPELLQAEAEFLRLALIVEIEFRDQLLAEIAARAFGEQCVLGAQFHAARKATFVLFVLANAHVAGSYPCDRAVVVEEDFRRGKPRMDFDGARFCSCT